MEHAPKLVAFDIDGTLTESKQNLTAPMAARILQLLEKIPVAVMSGGSWAQFTNQFLSKIPASPHFSNLYLFPTSAAQCYIWKHGSWQAAYGYVFTPEEKEKIIRALHTALGDTHFETPARMWGEQIEDRGTQITFSALGQQAPVDVKKAWDPSREKRRPLYEALVHALPEFSVALNATTSIDITHKGITKAYGIRRLSHMTGIAIDDMLYVGDALDEGGNDYVVKETGVATRAVGGPADTEAIIREILAA